MDEVFLICLMFELVTPGVGPVLTHDISRSPTPWLSASGDRNCGKRENLEKFKKKNNCWKPAFFIFPQCFPSLPNDKILQWTKLKAFADNKINI